VSLGVTLASLRPTAAHFGGLALVIVAMIAYFAVESRWSADELGRSLLRGAANAALGVVESIALIVIFALLFVT
jgi:hypothetical protein